MLSARNVNDHQIIFDEFRWISAADFATEHVRTQIKPDDVLLTIVGTIGRTAVVPKSVAPFALQRSVAVLRPSGVDSRYLAYLLESPVQQRWLTDNAKGTAQKGIYLKVLASAQVPLASAAEQTRIVDKLEELLSDLDAGVAELKAAQKKLAQYRQSLLKAAVEGRLTEAWRAQHVEPEESGAQLLERILRERRARWDAKQLAKFEAQGKVPPSGWQGKYPEPMPAKMSELPELPRGWTWATVDQLSPDDLANGRSVPTATSGAKVLRLNALKNGAVDLNEFKLGAWSDEEAKQFLVVNGDLLIARGNGSLKLVGRAGLVAGVNQQVAYPDTMIRLRLVDSVVRAAWIGLLWDAAGTRDHIEQRARTSAGIYKISQPDIVSVVVPVPPLSEQDHLLAEIAKEGDQLAATELSIDMALRQSTAQRKNILQAAFAGRLVPQDPNDEPASVLLARIRAERAVSGATEVRRRRAAAASS